MLFEGSVPALAASARACVVAQSAPIHPRGERLLGGEGAGLRLCDLVGTVVVDLVRHKGDIFPQSSDRSTAMSGSTGRAESPGPG